MQHMSETVELPPPPIAVKPRIATPLFVSGKALAAHLGCARQNIDRLCAEGTIERDPATGMFDQDRARIAYIRALQSARRGSQRAEADARLAKLKAHKMRLSILQ